MTSRRALLLTAALLVGFIALPAKTSTQSGLKALPASPAAPVDNPSTPEKVALGRLLFWDPILSGGKDVSCATCHRPDAGYAEPLDLSVGTALVKRNSQSVLNAAFNGLDVAGYYDPVVSPMFWDARVRSLEAQALEPIKAREEMRGDAYQESAALETVVARLEAIPDYRARFGRAFGGAGSVTAANLGRAIAAFERTLVANNSPFDRYMRGDASAMTPLQVQGMDRFARIGCADCHSGAMFSDFKPHVLGVPDNPKLADSDAGMRGAYAFRTPSLRNVSLTAPYMHNGTIGTLDAVVRFYDDVRRGGGRGGRGGRGPGGGRGGISRNPNVTPGDLDPFLRRLNTRGPRQDLVAFLEALTDATFDRTVPASVPSGLPVGGKGF